MSDSQLDYALMRSDSSRLGRFMSVDPLAGSLSNPQSLNRYSYVANDPINAIDPLGMEAVFCGAQYSYGECGGNAGFWGGGNFGGKVAENNREYSGGSEHIAQALERYNFIMKNHYDPLTQCRYSDGSFGGGAGYMCGGEDSGGPFGPYQFGRNQITTGRVTIGCRNVEDSAGSGAGHCLIVLFDGKNYTLIEAFPSADWSLNPFNRAGTTEVHINPPSPTNPIRLANVDVTYDASSTSAQMGCITTVASSYTNVPYRVLYQNSNTFVDDVAQACGIQPNLPFSARGRR